jgi:hypothetical protein
MALRTLFVLVAVAAVAVLADDYAITWDEPAHAIYANLVRDYFRSGGIDRRCDEFLNLRYYGPLADLVPALLAPGESLAAYRMRHVVCGAFTVATLVATWAVARLGGARLVPAFAVLALATLPRFVGHAFDNLKDVPFAGALTAFVAAMLAMGSTRDFRLRRWVVCGLADGVVLAVRPGGLPLVLALTLAFCALSDLLLGRHVARRGSLAPGFVAMLAVAWALMVMPWPFAHENPVWNPIVAMAVARAFPYSPTVLFDGAFVPSTDLPRRYFPTLLVLSTPPAHLALFAVGLARIAWIQLREPGTPRAFLHAAVAVWFVLPLAILVVTHPNVYDGIRHVLFLLPALATIAAIGGAALVELAPRPLRAGVAAGVAALLLTALPALVRLHPYQTTYYNALAGGLAGAERRFETDYWVSSYREAFDWVNARAREHPGHTVRVLAAGSGYLTPILALYRAENVEAEVVKDVPAARGLPDGVDYAIVTSRFGWSDAMFPDAPIVHAIGRDGAVFTVIRGRGDVTPTPSP